MNTKNMGPGTFTGQLYELVRNNGGGGVPISLNVDGPYGPPLEFGEYQGLLLLAGGIGITAIHSIFKYVLQLAQRGADIPSSMKHVKLVWTSRGADNFGMFANTMHDIHDTVAGNVRFTILLYLTGRPDA